MKVIALVGTDPSAMTCSNRENWNDMTPIVSHFEHKKKLWYSNDNDFKREIPGFNKNNKYMMRFRGYYVAAKAGTYGFRTRSDDGSQLWIKNKLVVNNDGNHGMRTRTANAKLTKGWNKLVVTFYENGGGAGLQVSVKVPGGKFTPLTAVMTRPLFRYGMRLDTFHYKTGRIGDWDKNIHDADWQPNGQKFFNRRWAHQKAVWYSNDNDFKRLVPGFNKNDKYIMRFRGMYKATQRGRYYFRTRSDDGSMLYLDKKLVVDNDGNHGMRTRTSSTILSRGLHSLNIVFYEVSFLLC